MKERLNIDRTRSVGLDDESPPVPAIPRVRFDFGADADRCPDGDGGTQFWDSLMGECYNVSCGFLYENVGGGCVFRNITRGLFVDYEDKDDCVMITLMPWELRNG